MAQLKKLEEQIDRMCLLLSFLHQQLTILHLSSPDNSDDIIACIRMQLEALEGLIQSTCNDLKEVRV